MPASAEEGLAALTADREFFAKSGLLPAAWNEIRRFPRFYLRSEATAFVSPPLPTDDADEETHAILTSDVSRCGLGIIAPRQLFPEQRLEIQMPDGLSYRVKVVWCRRVSQGKYAAGCVFVE